MTISTAAKVGSGAVFAAGTPASIYFSWDHITLYSVEREVLSKETLLSVNNESGDTKVVVVKKGTGENSPWTCKLAIKTGSTISSVTELEKKLPKEDGDKDNLEKQNNKSILVRKCARNRDTDSTPEKIKATLTFSEVENETQLIAALFGSQTTATTQST